MSPLNRLIWRAHSEACRNGRCWRDLRLRWFLYRNAYGGHVLESCSFRVHSPAFNDQCPRFFETASLLGSPVFVHASRAVHNLQLPLHAWIVVPRRKVVRATCNVEQSIVSFEISFFFYLFIFCFLFRETRLAFSKRLPSILLSRAVSFHDRREHLRRLKNRMASRANYVSVTARSAIVNVNVNTVPRCVPLCDKRPCFVPAIEGR